VEYINKHFEMQRVTPDIPQNITESFVRQLALLESYPCAAKCNFFYFFCFIDLCFPDMELILWGFPWKTGCEKTAFV
jgi:hypothetical protein